ncbi:MAG: hypothetical protein ACLFWB_00190 [Armatimonadota bacterium]
MKRTHVSIVICIIVASGLAIATAAAEDYTLRPIKVTANAPVEITLGATETVHAPIYRTAEGQWSELSVGRDDKGVSFSLPDDAVGSTVILLDKPDWLTLPDTDAPALDAASIGGDAVETGETIELGHLKTAPEEIMLTLRDETNPIAAHLARVYINGKSPASYGGSVSHSGSADGKHVDLLIKPGELPDDDYDISVSVPDASPGRNTFATTIAFSTAPMLRNGGFEQVDENNNPEFWSTGAWSTKPETEYEIKVVEDGHTGKCIMIKGIQDPLNLVCGQDVDLQIGKTYVLTGYYRGEGKAGHGSLIARSSEGKGQYDNYGGLKADGEWMQFEWELTPTDEDATNYTFYVRLSGVGTAYFDDLKLQPKDE